MVRVVIAALLSALLLALPAGKPDAFVFHGGLQIINGSGTLQLTRTLTQLPGTTTPAVAIWTQIGEPVAPGEMPSGTIVTATLGGVPVKVRACQVNHSIDGSAAWFWPWIDYSGQTITAGSSKTLQFTSVPGSWSTTTTRSTADWAALHAQLQLTNMATSATSAPDTNGAGVWLADFQPGSAISLKTLCTNDMGRVDVGVWPLVNTVTHRMLRVRMYFLVTEKADGSLGPILGEGPFVENMQAFPAIAGGFGRYDFDAAFIVNGVTIRNYPGVHAYFGTMQPIMRGDAQWDYLTGTDPQIDAGWSSYTDVRHTQRIPPYRDGLPTGSSYLGVATSASITSINTTTGLFTVSGSILAIADPNPASLPKTAIDFFGTSAPGGVQFGKVYYQCPLSSSTFNLYDTFDHATSCGATGQIIPTTAGSGVSAEISIAPNSSGQMTISYGSGGERPEIGPQTEQVTGMFLGNTVARRRIARVEAYVLWDIQMWLLGPDGCMFSMEDAAHTPALPNCAGGTGLTSHPVTWFQSAKTGPTVSADINGGVYPSGGLPVMDYDGPHWPAAIYGVWLMTGDPELQFLLGLNAQAAVISKFPNAAWRNPTINGTQYFAPQFLAHQPGTLRWSGWGGRDQADGAFAQTDNSAERGVLLNELNDSVNSFLAYWTFIKPASYAALGTPIDDDVVGTDTVSSAYISNFMYWFMLHGIEKTVALEGAFVPNAATFLNKAANINVGLYTINCPYYGDSFNLGDATSNSGSPSPGTYVSSVADIGYGNGASATFTAGSPNVTLNDFNNASMGSSGTLMQPGWKVRFLNYDSNSGGPYTVPAPFVPGQTYYVLSLSGGQAQLGNSFPGTPIVPTGFSGTIIAGSVYVPVGGTCPATSSVMFIGGAGGSGYVNQQLGSLGYAAALGTTTTSGTALSAFNILNARNPATFGDYAASSKYAVGPTW